MTDLTVIVISYRRPHLLRDTLDSIRQRLGWLTAKVVVVDNATNPDTQAVISAASVDQAWYLPENKGLNWPIEHLVSPELDSEFTCISDHDLHYARPFSLFLSFLRDNKDVQYAKGCDSIEHPSYGEREYLGERWRLKHTERGGGVILRTQKLRETFPLPKGNIELDWHLCYRGGPFGVLPGTVAHIGYKESTWQSGEVAEPFILVDGKIVPNQKPLPCQSV